MAYSYGIGQNAYLTSILTFILAPECLYKPFLRSLKMSSKSRYWGLLPCLSLRGR